MQSWATQELEDVKLGDPRRTRRLITIVEALAAQPAVSVPQACDGSRSEIKATYRFWADEHVQPAAIRQGHESSTVKRARHAGRVLAIQDTTDLDYAHHPATTGLGRLDNQWQNGLKVHSTLGVSVTGVPLGLLDQHVWVRSSKRKHISRQRRKRLTRQKESQRWLSAFQASQDILPPEVGVITVADSEADIFDLFATPRRPGADYLIRGTHNRRVDTTARYLWETIEAAPVRGHESVNLRARPHQAARTADLAVRSATVTVLPPRHHRKRAQLQPLTMNVLLVMEETPPPEVAEPIVWLLLTTLPIESWEEVQQAITWYTYRWLIERYHFVYKSGCRIEKLQLETADRLQRALATYSVVAWRLLWLTYQARETPAASCETVLEPAEWQALYARHHSTVEVPATPPTLHDAVHWIAQLGGFLDRAGDGEPGVQTIWQGLRHLSDLTTMWRLHHPDPIPLPPTSG
jgi:hypothetical protein